VNDRWAVLDWMGSVNHSLMVWANAYYWPTIWVLVFLGCFLGMTPLRSHHEHTFPQVVAIQIRKVILWVSVLLIALPFVMMYVYDMTTGRELGESTAPVKDWFADLTRTFAPGLIVSAAIGFAGRLFWARFCQPFISNLLRSGRVEQTKDTPSDIRTEAQRYRAKDFSPAKYYKRDKIFLGITADKKPVYVPLSTWRETNTQLIGPTRYGKGVIIGALMDQAIRLGDATVYIDPKWDRFAPIIMYLAAKAMGRPFYYVSLNDGAPGAWAPFEGGTERDAFARMEVGFGLEDTGDPGTDYYKTLEREILAKAFKESRTIPGLAQALSGAVGNKSRSQLLRWREYASLCPAPGTGFSLAKALQEGAVVYVQGSLDDSVIKVATKLFIMEVIQEARRLDSARPHHLTFIIDELRFLVSKQLADALATVVGFRVNIVTAYQSTKDLLAPDDRTLNGQALFQSINTNSQIKAVYGGAEFDTAEWIADLTGTVQKEVRKFEGTEVRPGGGEVWGKNRMIGAQEEALVHPNVVMTLPPRVCVVIRPLELATITHTAFISLAKKETEAFKSYIASLSASPPDSHESDAQVELEKLDLELDQDAPPPPFSPEKTEPEVPTVDTDIPSSGAGTPGLSAALLSVALNPAASTLKEVPPPSAPSNHGKKRPGPKKAPTNKPAPSPATDPAMLAALAMAADAPDDAPPPSAVADSEVAREPTPARDLVSDEALLGLLDEEEEED